MICMQHLAQARKGRTARKPWPFFRHPKGPRRRPTAAILSMTQHRLSTSNIRRPWSRTPGQRRHQRIHLEESRSSQQGSGTQVGRAKSLLFMHRLVQTRKGRIAQKPGKDYGKNTPRPCQSTSGSRQLAADAQRRPNCELYNGQWPYTMPRPAAPATGPGTAPATTTRRGGSRGRRCRDADRDHRRPAP